MNRSNVRNAIAHRAGHADERFVKNCPWLNLEVRDPVNVSGSQYIRYQRAVCEYVLLLAERLARHFNLQPQSGIDKLRIVTPSLILQSAEGSFIVAVENRRCHGLAPFLRPPKGILSVMFRQLPGIEWRRLRGYYFHVSETLEGDVPGFRGAQPIPEGCLVFAFNCVSISEVPSFHILDCSRF